MNFSDKLFIFVTFNYILNSLTRNIYLINFQTIFTCNIKKYIYKIKIRFAKKRYQKQFLWKHEIFQRSFTLHVLRLRIIWINFLKRLFLMDRAVIELFTVSITTLEKLSNKSSFYKKAGKL